MASENITAPSSVDGIRLLTLTGPAIALLFAAAFLGIWRRWKDLRYLIWIAAAFITFSIALLFQIFSVPADAGLNTMVSGVLYTSASLLFIEGLLRRLRLSQNYLLVFGISFLVLAGIWYFFYIHRDLDTRVYILNFGLALLLLVTAIKIGRVAGRTMDRVLFWTILIFALQFLPRTILTVGYVGTRRDSATLTRSPFWVWMNFSFTVFTVVLGLVLLGTIASDIVRSLRRKANTDPLTGLLNRRGFEEFVDHTGLEKGALVLLDIDDFKLINDSFGHAAGDTVLINVAAVLQDCIRSSDAAARLGGEEFAVFVQGLNREDTFALAERLRHQIARIRCGNRLFRNHTVTASLGLVEFGPGEHLMQAMHRADDLLYEAKRNGKNQTMTDWQNTLAT